MNYIRTITFTLLAISTISCSVIQKPSHNHNGSVYNRPVQLGEIDIPPLNDIEFITPDYKPSKKHASSRVKPADIIPSYDFTRLELEHVKFSNHSPFEGNSNSHSINLDSERNKFTFPLEKSRLSSRYGSRGRGFHSGIDLLEEGGTPIYAAFDGVVRISKPYAGYGNIVVLRHSNGLETIYSHNTKNLVNAGDFVRSGDKIALVGKTGRTSGATHLHFETRILGQTFDPQLLVDVENKTLQRGTLEIRQNGDRITVSNSKSGIKDEQKPVQPAPEKITTSTPPPKPSTTTSNTAIKHHTVVKGDTLYGISKKYNTSVSAICKLNNITEKTTLSLGRKLRVK